MGLKPSSVIKGYAGINSILLRGQISSKYHDREICKYKKEWFHLQFETGHDQEHVSDGDVVDMVTQLHSGLQAITSLPTCPSPAHLLPLLL